MHGKTNLFFGVTCNDESITIRPEVCINNVNKINFNIFSEEPLFNICMQDLANNENADHGKI